MSTPVLSILDNFELTDVDGGTIAGKQGEAGDSASTPFEWSLSGSPFSASPAVAGAVKPLIGTLATATILKVYDSSIDVPATWDFLWFKSDQDCYIQLITAATEVRIKVSAGVPFKLSKQSIIASAGTSAITGGSEPAVAVIAKVYIGNYSGNTMNFQFYVID